MSVKRAKLKLIPQVIENEATAKLTGDLLDRHLTDLQSVQDEKAVVELFTGGTTQLINVFDALTRSTRQEGLLDIVDKLTDILMAGNDAGKEVKRCIILSVTESCMDVVTSSVVTLIHKIEILKSFNIVLENCPAAAKCDILVRDGFTEKLSLLFNSIGQVGDYEVQVGIIEFIFRLVPKSKRKEHLKSILENSDQWKEFLNIRDSNFEIDCRYFLNKLNKQNNCPMTRVFSYPAELVSIDGIKLHKPSDAGYDDFWVDFNEGSKRIGIFCEPNFLSSQQNEDVEQMWETVSICAQDVNKYSCTVQGKLWKAVLELNPGSEILSNKEADNLSHLVTIAVGQECDLKRILENILTIHHKASSVDIPIYIIQKPSNQTTSSAVMLKELASHKAQTLPQQQGNRNVVRSKISIPSEPMTTPASSVITSNSEHQAIWQELQERQRQQKEEQAKALDKSGCEEKGKANVVEDADRSKGKGIFTLEDVQSSSITTNNNFDMTSHCGRNSIGKNDSDFKINESSKIASVTGNVENETINLFKAIEKRNDTAVRSQAKVKASAKCTDMTWHHMDARASDAHVNVVNSPVTEAGDNNFCFQHSQKKYSCGTKSTTCVPNTINEMETLKESHEQTATGDWKTKNRKSQPSDSQKKKVNATTPDSKLDCQPSPNMRTKSLRSRMRANAPVVLVQNAEKAQSDSNPSQLDFIPGTLPGAMQKDCRQLRYRRESKNGQIKKTKTNINHEDVILESTASSVYESWSSHRKVKSDDRKNKQKQASSDKIKISPKDNSHRVRVKKSKVQNTISPGNASVDDFKPSKNFRSLRSSARKVAENTDSMTTIDHSKANGKRIGKTYESKTSFELVQGTGEGDVYSATKCFTDFLPMLQEKKKVEQRVERNKVKYQRISEAKSANLLTYDISLQVSPISAGKDDVCNESSTKSKETNKTSVVEDPQKLKAANRKHLEQSDIASFSSSGELFVVTETLNGSDKENEVVKETQFEMSPLCSLNSLEVTDKDKKQAFDSSKKNYQLPKKSKLPEAPNICVPSHLDKLNTLLPSNLESSYVFRKHTGIKANSFNTYVGSQEREMDNTQTILKAPESKFAERNAGCKTKAENSVLKPKNAIPGLLTVEDDKLEKVCDIKKTVKTANTQECSEANSCSALMNNQQAITGKGQAQISLQSTETTVPARKLQSQNKTVSYKESNLDYQSCNAGNVKNASQVQNKMSKKINVESIVLDNHAVPASRNVSEMSPNDGMKKSRCNMYSVSALGSRAPKKPKKSDETGRHIWTSHRMEKTVTTMSYSKSVYSLSSDPYDFEAECRKRAVESPNIAPLQVSTIPKQSSGVEKHAESGGEYYKKHCNDKNQLPSNYSNKILMKNCSKNNASTLKAKQIFQRLGKSSPCAEIKQCNQSNSKGRTSVDFATVRQTLQDKRDTNFSFGGDTDAQDGNSDGGSSKFCLYASQIETNKSDSGLVFPHLDDSIPCTPIQEKDICEGPNITERKSTVSDLSWLAKAKRPLEKPKQKAGKTYNRNKSDDLTHQATYEDEELEFGTKYSSLFGKQPSEIVSILNKAPKPKKKCGTPGKRHKLFSPLDIRMSRERPLVPNSESRQQKYQCKDISPIKNQKDETLAPVLTNSTRHVNPLLGWKAERSLSFKTPSIEENKSSDSDLSEIAAEDNHHSFRKLDNQKHDSEKLSSETTDVRQHSVDSWSLVSSKIDQQLQDVIDRLSGNVSYQFYAGTVSGPSSYRRPTKSALKRKYPSISSKTDSGDGDSDTDNHFSDHEESTQQRKFIPRKLFKSDMTPVRPEHNSFSMKKTGHMGESLAGAHICNQKQKCKSQANKKCKFQANKKCKFQANKKCSDKKTAHGTKTSDQKISRERKWKQVKHVSPFGKLDEKFTSTSHIRCEMTPDTCLPKNLRSCTESPEEPLLSSGLQLSPFTSLHLSSSNSPLIGFWEKSSDGHKIDALPQTTLLDSIRKELMISSVSHVSEDPEQTVDSSALDINETVSMGFDNLKEFLVKKNSSCQKETRLGSDDIEGTVKSAHQYITSLWGTEQNKRMSAVETFQHAAQDIFTRMNRDFKEAQQNDVTATLLWTQEIEKVRKYNASMQRELKRLKKAHEVLNSELQRAQTEGETAQISFKTAMKQDIDALQRKLVGKCNEHALDVMRRCLHMSLFS